MSLQRHTESNGATYWTVTTSEWSGAYGEQLRAQGYRYCGFGTYGIIVAAPGQPCYATVTPSGPAIIATVPQDEPAPSQGPAGPVVDTTCKRCNDSKPSAAAVSAATSPQAMAAAAARAQTPAGYPWWLFVLAALTLAQVVKNG